MGTVKQLTDVEVANLLRSSYASFRGLTESMNQRGYKVTIRQATKEVVITKEVRL